MITGEFSVVAKRFPDGSSTELANNLIFKLPSPVTLLKVTTNVLLSVEGFVTTGLSADGPELITVTSEFTKEPVAKTSENTKSNATTSSFVPVKLPSVTACLVMVTVGVVLSTVIVVAFTVAASPLFAASNTEPAAMDNPKSPSPDSPVTE